MSTFLLSRDWKERYENVQFFARRDDFASVVGQGFGPAAGLPPGHCPTVVISLVAARRYVGQAILSPAGAASSARIHPGHCPRKGARS